MFAMFHADGSPVGTECITEADGCESRWEMRPWSYGRRHFVSGDRIQTGATVSENHVPGSHVAESVLFSRLTPWWSR